MAKFTKQLSGNGIVIHGDVQVNARGKQRGMTGGLAHFSQGSATGQCMTNECVAPVVNRQSAQAFQTERLTSGPKAFTDCVPNQSLAKPCRTQATNQCIARPRPLA